MNYIYLEIMRYDDGSIENIDVMRDSEHEFAIFESREGADDWLEDNHSLGYDYTRVEI